MNCKVDPPSALQSLTASVVSSTAITVNIRSPIETSNQSHYNVRYYGVKYDTQVRILSIQASTIGDYGSFNITQLQAYTKYFIQVEAGYAFGYGPSSVLITVTSQSAPSSPPLNLTLSYISTQVATIAWLPPAAVMQNGIITHYQLALTNTDTSVANTVTVSSGYTSYSWTNLTVHANYSLTVSAATTEGLGPQSLLLFSTIAPEISYLMNTVPVVSTYAFDGIVLTLSISWNKAEGVCYTTQYMINLYYGGAILVSTNVVQSPANASFNLMQQPSLEASYIFFIELCETATGYCASTIQYEWTNPLNISQNTTQSSQTEPSSPPNSAGDVSSNILCSLSVPIIAFAFILAIVLALLLFIFLCVIIKSTRKSASFLDNQPNSNDNSLEINEISGVATEDIQLDIDDTPMSSMNTNTDECTSMPTLI